MVCKDLTLIDLKYINDTVYKMVLKASEKLPPIKAGQFVHLKINDNGFLLRRPFCVYDYTDYTISLIVAVVGDGTKVLSQAKIGEKISTIFPIGNGFSILDSQKNVVLLGGGIGCAPLLTAYKNYADKNFSVYLGFANKAAVMMDDDFKKAYNNVTVCTDNGSFGVKGYALQVMLDDIKSGKTKADIILTCGNENMIKAVKAATDKLKIPTLMSGEIRMGCGVGACLVCACAVKEGDKIVNYRACVDGPVFDLAKVVM